MSTKQAATRKFSAQRHCQQQWKFSASDSSSDILKFGSWNVRGWSLDPAQQLRSNTVKALNLDIICVNETFLLEEQELNIPGYKWFGNNRKHIAKRACRGSGGVGILIKRSTLEHFDVAVISDKFEGILWVQLIHRLSKRSIGVCVCYLPPIGSSKGDQSAEFFESLKALIVENYSVEDFVICGDFNARCGELADIAESENHPIPKREAVDKSSNQLGKELISTLKALDLCIVNGRFAKSYDGFTSVSNKGMSVVDYIISPIKSFRALSNFRVLDPYQIAIDNNIALDSSMPDHRILAVDLALNSLSSRKGIKSSNSNGTTNKIKIKAMPEDYLRDPSTVERIEALAVELEHNTHTKSDASHLNKIYQEFCTIIDSQLDTKQIRCS